MNSDGDEGAHHVVMEKMALLAPWCTAVVEDTKVQAPPAQALPAPLDTLITPQAIIVHAPSMWPYKQWPTAHFRQLVVKLIEAGYQVVLTGSSSQIDQDCIQQLRDIAPSPQLIDSSGQLNFNQLVGLFQRARLYVGPDTSVTHLAASSGIHVLALFGPTNPVRWGPWPSSPDIRQAYIPQTFEQKVHNITLLQSAKTCVPCSKAGCENHTQSHSDCLNEISPDRVLKTVHMYY